GHPPARGPRALLRAPPSARPRGPPPPPARHRVRRGRVRAHPPLLAPRPGRARARARRLGDLAPRAAPAAPREPEAPRPHALLRAPGGLARRRLRRRLPAAEAARRAECRAPRCPARDMTDGAAVAHDVHELAQVVVVGSGAGGAVVAREAAALGYAGARIPRNERGCLGTGVCAFGCPQDAKQAMHVSYVPRALAAGARLFTRCRVDKILLSAGKAIGVVGRFVDAEGRERG